MSVHIFKSRTLLLRNVKNSNNRLEHSPSSRPRLKNTGRFREEYTGKSLEHGSIIPAGTGVFSASFLQVPSGSGDRNLRPGDLENNF